MLTAILCRYKRRMKEMKDIIKAESAKNATN